VSKPPQSAARFQPLRRASPARRRLLFIVGPLTWVIALLVLVVVLRRFYAVEFALLLLAGSFCVGLVWHGLNRAARVRRERQLG
jgi:hypothetical protein